MKKISLDEIKISSFTTELNAQKTNTAQGGKTGGKGGECLTVVTFGLWTVCCGSEGQLCSQYGTCVE